MNIDRTLFIIFVTYYVYKYGIPPILLNYFLYLHHISNKFFIAYNKIIHPDYWFDKIEANDLFSMNSNNNNNNNTQPKKYEDKYLDDIRTLNKDWEFTDEEQIELPKLTQKFFENSKQNMLDKMEQILIEISNLEKDIAEDIDAENYIDSENYYDDENYKPQTLEERNKERRDQIDFFKQEYDNIKNEVLTEEGLERLSVKSNEYARQTIINNRLDKLSNCYVMEKTPIGNVLMIYDKKMEKFVYYSDASVPYRYLEVVGRKYVKLFNCRPIFIDMEEELRLFEEKWEKEQLLKKEKQEEEEKRRKMDVTNMDTQNSETKKKNVFAKFKSYNTDAGGKISMAPPPKNSIPTKSVSENKENEKILLKERANCYSYEGKLSNFHFLKRVEKKVFNKKLGLTFADFKKMNK
jgi:hypothetical protein